MTVIDLSHVLGEGMPVYPGTEPPRISDACTVERDGFAEKRIELFSHAGTHIDVPAHMIEGAATIEGLEADCFLGPGCVVDLSELGRKRVGIADLEGERSRIAGAEFVLLRSGWDARWGDPSYFLNYPVLSLEAARWLAGFHLKGLGADMISFDEMGSTTMAVHKVFLGKGTVLAENLTGLERLVGREFVFSCLPLKIPGGDGSPVRAVAIL
ncbi:MAG: cyclase family protein [Candidatus Aminicenantes bacterium]|nr:cyclase family protein [Candidatus Aminicenantes bacterium]